MLRLLALVTGIFLLWVAYEAIRTTGVDWDTIAILFILLTGSLTVLGAVYGEWRI